jgi:CelD/BcsL family acetyltransferase involved in cellulose biosynthesis
VVTVAQEWQDETHQLKFLFGEYCCFRVSFKAAELAVHPLRLGSSLDETTASVLPVLRRHGAVAIPAHPIVGAPAWLKVTPRYVRYIAATGPYHVVELGSSFDEYLQNKARRHRHELRRKLRRFVERSEGAIDLRSYRSVSEAREFFAVAASVSVKTYQHRLLAVGLPPTPETRAELLARAARDGMRGYALFHRGAAIAYGFAKVSEDYLRFVHIGYDPAFADWSPGIVLVHEALRRAWAERRFALVDFGAGEAQYKRAFSTGTISCATVFIFGRHARRLALVVSHRTATAVSDRCGSVLDRFGVKQQVKRYLRGRAVHERS